MKAPEDIDLRFTKLSEAFGMLEVLAERYVSHLATIYDSPVFADLHCRAKHVLDTAKRLADEAMDDRRAEG